MKMSHSRSPVPLADRSVVFSYNLELPLVARDYELRDYYELERALEDAFDLLCTRLKLTRGRTTIKVCGRRLKFSVEVANRNERLVIAWNQKNDCKVISTAAYHFEYYAGMFNAATR